jgi:hypothetical protein
VGKSGLFGCIGINVVGTLYVHGSKNNLTLIVLNEDKQDSENKKLSQFKSFAQERTSS